MAHDDTDHTKDLPGPDKRRATAAMVSAALDELAALGDPDAIAAHLDALGVRGWQNDDYHEGPLTYYLERVTGGLVGIHRAEPGAPFYALPDDPAPPDPAAVPVADDPALRDLSALPVPAVLGDFIDRFDLGAYPRLVLSVPEGVVSSGWMSGASENASENAPDQARRARLRAEVAVVRSSFTRPPTDSQLGTLLTAMFQTPDLEALPVGQLEDLLGLLQGLKAGDPEARARYLSLQPKKPET
jgi:hypothetical protein